MKTPARARRVRLATLPTPALVSGRPLEPGLVTTLRSAWRERFANPRDRLGLAIGVSVLLHLIVLSTRFVPPSVSAMRPVDPGLEVILLNARSESRPLTPQVSAQIDLVGGGDRVEGGARSPVPAQDRIEDGEASMRQRKAQLEAQQSRLLALASASAPVPRYGERPLSEAGPQPPGADELDIDAVITRMQSRIERQIADYDKRPKRLTFGINAVGVSYAQYVAAWAARIERIGSEHYPPEARGKMYDSLIITVEIDRDGQVVNVLIDRPSKHPALNRAARRIVRAGAPYPPFSPEMAKEGDILQITRTWTFASEALATAPTSGAGRVGGEGRYLGAASALRGSAQ